MTFLKEQQPLVEDSLLTKYFGVRDTTLKDLYTETSSDASFYKVWPKELTAAYPSHARESKLSTSPSFFSSFPSTPNFLAAC